MSAALDLVLSALSGVREVGTHWQARCPAHDDKKPSLSVKDGERGVIVKCWSGCSFASIVEAMGLRASDLFHLPMSEDEIARRAGLATRAVLAHHALVVLIAANQGPPFAGRDLLDIREAHRILAPAPTTRFPAWCARALLAGRPLPDRHQTRLCNEIAALQVGLPRVSRENGTTSLKRPIKAKLGDTYAAP